MTQAVCFKMFSGFNFWLAPPNGILAQSINSKSAPWFLCLTYFIRKINWKSKTYTSVLYLLIDLWFCFEVIKATFAKDACVDLFSLFYREFAPFHWVWWRYIKSTYFISFFKSFKYWGMCCISCLYHLYTSFGGGNGIFTIVFETSWNMNTYNWNIYRIFIVGLWIFPLAKVKIGVFKRKR